jgi:hypothetical protein
MASEILGLFGGQTPQQLRNAFLDSTMVSPQQMAQQGLLQQVVSMGQNAGSMIGAGAGRLFGGKVPGEVEQETIANIYQDIQKLDLPTESAKYKMFATKLGEAGLSQQAALASKKASEAYSSELKNKETLLGIEGKTLENTLNRATIMPKVKAAYLANQTAVAALDKAKQDYELANQINPTKVAQAKQNLATAQQAYAQADKTNPVAYAQAKQTLATAQQAYAQANRIDPLEVKKAQQALINSQQAYAQTNAQMAQFNALSPGVIEQARLETQAKQMDVDKEVSLKASQQIMSEFTPGSPEYNAALNNILAIQSPSSLTPKPVNFGTDREAYSSAMYGGKPFKDLTPTEQAAVNLKLKEKSVDVARAGAYEIGKDLTAFDNAIKDNTVSFQAAQTAKTLLREAKASDNTDAWEAARTTVARAVGKSKLSNEDIKRLGGSPEIVQAVKDITSKAFTGTPTLDTQRKLYATAAIIERFEAEQINKQADRFTAAAAEAGFSKDPGVYFPKVGAGGSVSWKDL